MTARCPYYRGLLAVSHNSLYLPKAWHPAPQRHSQLIEALTKSRLVRSSSSETHSEVHDQSHVELGPFREIQFPNTWNGRRAEREAHKLWASYWRTVPQIDKALTFKIDDRHQTDLPKVASVTREGVIFAKDDTQGERYWRLTHPISLSTRLHRFRLGIRGISRSAFLPTFRRWLYGGPSLPLIAKLQWLISGPSQLPWKRRSRWIRWSVAWLGIFLTSTAVFVAFKMQPGPLTERSRFIIDAARVRLDKVTSAQRDRAEATMWEKIRKLRTPDIYEKARLGSVFDRLLLACGLRNTRWRLFIVDDPGNYFRNAFCL